MNEALVFPRPPPLTPCPPVRDIARAELRLLRAAKFSEKSSFSVGNVVGKSKPTKAADGGAKAQVGWCPLSVLLRALRVLGDDFFESFFPPAGLCQQYSILFSDYHPSPLGLGILPSSLDL